MAYEWRVLRRALRWLVDLAAIAACIICILHFSRRRSVDCTWERMRAACSVEVEDSLGRVERDAVTGVRGAAYRSGAVVGLVTDAQNHGEHALFGTREIQLDDVADAERLRAFAADHDPDHIVIVSGVARPRVVTAMFFAALLVYGVVSRRRWRSVLARRES